jgi:hypothetical protein
MARVYLLYAYRKVDLNEEKQAALRFLDKHLELLKSTSAEQMENYNRNLRLSTTYADRVACNHDLRQIDKAILSVLKWAEQSGQTRQTRITDTDEEGYFQLQKVVPGKHYLIVRGQAGANNAYWRLDVWVKPGEDVSIKVSSVEKACLRSA